MGERGEAWLQEGVDHIAKDGCPYCGQSVKGLPLIDAYHKVFGDAYRDMKAAVKCIIELAVLFDYDGAELREGNDVELNLRDADTTADPDALAGVRTIYKGYISLIEREVDGWAPRKIALDTDRVRPGRERQ